MEKITTGEFANMKAGATDIFMKREGNHWLLQMQDEKYGVLFVPIKHQRGTYYKMKPLKTFSEAWYWSL